MGNKIFAGIPGLFVVGSAILFFIGLAVHVFSDDVYTDIQLHDVMYVVSPLYIFTGIALLFVLFAIIYYLFPLLFGRYMNERIGRIHFYVTLIGILCILLSMHFLTGRPEQYSTYANFETFNGVDSLAIFFLVVSILIFIAQLLFVANFFYSIFKGQKSFK